MDANDFLCFQLSGWLVTALLSVLRCVWTRDQMMRFFFFGENSQVVLQFVLVLPILSSHGYMCTHGPSAHLAPWDRSRRHNTLQFHIHVSPILTRVCLWKNHRKWCPFFRLVAERPGY